jgi:hypothetical protein
VLQAFVALVLDDWRCAVAGRTSQVRFRLHRAWPAPADADAGLPGRRWKTRSREPWGTVPTAAAVRLLFERCTFSAVGRRPLRWEEPEASQLSSGGWWCGFVLRGDLEALSFQVASGLDEVAGIPPAAWSAGRGVLPERLENLTVVDPRDGSVGVYHIQHGERDCRLLSVWTQRTAGVPEVSFANARRQACDLFLNVLMTRGYL